jgi:aryl-alcohol dehydrogenase-like predicted oxidoreductase
MPSQLARRRLGGQGLEVSALGLGCMGMSEFYGSADQAASMAVLHRALDLGVNLLDTADMYGVGANERLLSELLQHRRDEVVLATKFGILRGPDGERLGIDGRPEYVRSACERSLQRLGVDHIDLYYLHRVDPKVPIEDTVGAMAGLVAAGKVRHLGLSEVSAATLRRAAAVHPIAAVQSEYSLWSRDVERGVLPACRELGVGFVAYSPLGRGFLSGAIQCADDLSPDDWRRANPRFARENLSFNLQFVAAVTALAAARGCTPAQLALAWLLDQGDDIVPIPGTRRISRLEENLAAAQLSLSDRERAQLQGVMTAIEIRGTRYPAEVMAQLNA